jgi:hypothetical protein
VAYPEADPKKYPRKVENVRSILKLLTTVGLETGFISLEKLWEPG